MKIFFYSNILCDTKSPGIKEFANVKRKTVKNGLMRGGGKYKSRSIGASEN